MFCGKCSQLCRCCSVAAHLCRGSKSFAELRWRHFARSCPPRTGGLTSERLPLSSNLSLRDLPIRDFSLVKANLKESLNRGHHAAYNLFSGRRYIVVFRFHQGLIHNILGQLWVADNSSQYLTPPNAPLHTVCSPPGRASKAREGLCPVF